ncbi:MAG: hypothetical protein AWM53_00390 [Candidatus Dichloromethanomonas elyunquensis]|nr:MAG: hypothetical protein AWM53_00390 [Candidatus Dichloromethanomonas elyunquensis]
MSEQVSFRAKIKDKSLNFSPLLSQSLNCITPADFKELTEEVCIDHLSWYRCSYLTGY